MVTAIARILAVVAATAPGPDPGAAGPTAPDPSRAVASALGKGGFPWYDAAKDALKSVPIPTTPCSDPTPGPRSGGGRGWGDAVALGGFGLALAALLGFLAWLWRRYEPAAVTPGAAPGRRGGPARFEELPAGIRGPLGSSDPWQEAIRLRDRGDLAGAIICLFAHQLLTLDRLGLVRLAPGRTGRQIVRAVADAEFRGLVGPTLRLFEAACYGHRAPSADEFAAVWLGAEAFERRVAGGGDGRGLRARIAPALLLAAGLLPAGCGPGEVDTTYGRSRGRSINGTGVLADLLRAEGHEVRAAVRLNATLGDWAEVLVRFSPHPGPPSREEGRWFLDWLRARRGRKLLYVPRDHDAGPEFWAAMLAVQPPGTPAEVLDRIGRNRDRGVSPDFAPRPKPKDTAPASEWFSIAPGVGAASTCRALEGSWAEGVDAPAAAVARHETFRAQEGEPVLLAGDGSPLVVSWTFDNGSRVLAVANASFLLNASMLNRARRPIAIRAVEWLGPAPGRVAFVEGPSVLDGRDEVPSSSPLRLFQVAPFGRVAGHWLAFATILAMARAVRLGRPRPDPPSGVERPSAHPEALGSLLARTGRDDVARALLEAYRRWRHPSHPSGRPSPTAPPPPGTSR